MHSPNSNKSQFKGSVFDSHWGVSTTNDERQEFVAPLKGNTALGRAGAIKPGRDRRHYFAGIGLFKPAPICSNWFGFGLLHQISIIPSAVELISLDHIFGMGSNDAGPRWLDEARHESSLEFGKAPV